MRTKPPPPREAEIQKAAIAFLRHLGWRTFRRNTGVMRAAHKGHQRIVRFSEPGMSDLWGVLPSGHHFELEMKRPGNWPTPEQVAWLRSMNGVGGSVAFWVDNLDDLEEVARFVMAGGRIAYAGNSGQYRLVQRKDDDDV